MATKTKAKPNRLIEWLPVRALEISWEAAQRAFNERWARSIADNFDPDLLGVIDVTRRDSNGALPHHRRSTSHRRDAHPWLG